jgi:hypothetical protein
MHKSKIKINLLNTLACILLKKLPKQMHEDLIHISRQDFSDLNHCILILAQVVSTKYLTESEAQRLNYMFRTYEQASSNIEKTITQ